MRGKYFPFSSMIWYISGPGRCRLSFMFASLSSFLPSALQPVSLGARPPEDLSPSPSTPPDAPFADPPRKKEKEKKEKLPNEVCPVLLPVYNSHLAIRLSSSSGLPLQSLYSHSASKYSLFLRSLVTIDPYKPSTRPPMILALISSAPTPMVQRRPPTLSLPLHPPPPPLPVQVVA